MVDSDEAVGPVGPTARLEVRNGRLVAVSDTVVTDDDVTSTLDEIRHRVP